MSRNKQPLRNFTSTLSSRNHIAMKPSPTVIDPSGGKRGERGDHWVDGSGQNFCNPWSSYKDRVSTWSNCPLSSSRLVFLVYGFSKRLKTPNRVSADPPVCLQGALRPIHDIPKTHRTEFSRRLQRSRRPIHYPHRQTHFRNRCGL